MTTADTQNIGERVRARTGEQLRVGPVRRLASAAAELERARAAIAGDPLQTLVHIRRARDSVADGMSELQQIAAGLRPAAVSARPDDGPEHARRLLERDLHDGTQQRFIWLDVTMQLAERLIRRGALADGLTALVAALDGMGAGRRELGRFARGMRPDMLHRGGLRAALEDLTRRSTVPAHLDVAVETAIGEALESAVYFLVCEALANTAKHSGARQVDVNVAQRGSALEVTVADDGRGGASVADGTGLRGLADRVGALGGRLIVDSLTGHGTTLTARIPVDER